MTRARFHLLMTSFARDKFERDLVRFPGSGSRADDILRDAIVRRDDPPAADSRLA